MKAKKQSRILSLLLVLVIIAGMLPLSAVTASAANDTVEVSTWDELKRALDYTTNCSVVKVVQDIETKALNGHTGLHQDNIIFMTMAMDKVLDLNGHTVNAYVKYYSEVGQGYLINISHKDARLTIRDSVGGGALIGEFNQEFYFQFINVSGGTLVMESGTVKMLCPSKDNQYKKCAISVSGTAIFNGGEVLTQVTSPGGEREERYLSRRLQAIRGEKGGSVTINGGTFDRVVLHSSPTPENQGKYELVVNGGFFRQSIALILIGDVYASNFDHLPMQINDAYFMRTTDRLDPCRLVIGGKMKNFYDNNWDYDLLYNDIPGATLDDAKTMMWGLTPHLISENGAIFTDVHDGNWYVRGNMRRSVENGGPIMAFQGMSLGVQGSIARVISKAYGLKEIQLDGETIEYDDFAYKAKQYDASAERGHSLKFVWYPLSSMLRANGYYYDSNGFNVTVDADGSVNTYAMACPEASGNDVFATYYYLGTTNVDKLTLVDHKYALLRQTDNGVKTVATENFGAKVAQWVDRTVTLKNIYLNIDSPLVEGDFYSGTITVDEDSPYTLEDRSGHWAGEENYLDLVEGISHWPAQLNEKYGRELCLTAKDGYKFDKNNPPKIKFRGLNRECSEIFVRVKDEKTMYVNLYSYPSEMIQNAWGTISGLKDGHKISEVSIQPEEKTFDLQIQKIQRVKNGTVYNTSPEDIIDAASTYRIQVTGVGKYEKTFRNGPWEFDHTYNRFVNTLVKLRMNNTQYTALNFKDALYDQNCKAYVIDVTPEPDVTIYNHLSLGGPYPWVGKVFTFDEKITGLPDGVTVQTYRWTDDEGQWLSYKDPFEDGKTYSCEIFLECSEGYQIADLDHLTIYVNGIEASVGKWGKVTTAQVQYSRSISSGVFGKIESFLDDSDVTVSLFASGKTIPEYVVTVPGGIKDSSGKYITTYDIPDVKAGTYTMKVSKMNHATREYTIELGERAEEKPLEIHLMGDINGDGKINTSDMNRANLHTKGKSTLTGYEFVCADINGDSKVNTSDMNKLNLHVKGKSLLW